MVTIYRKILIIFEIDNYDKNLAKAIIPYKFTDNRGLSQNFCRKLFLKGQY